MTKAPDEAARIRSWPGIASRGPMPRRPYVVGSGLDVWQIVDVLEEYGGQQSALLVDHPLLDETMLALAVAYSARFPDEIELHRRRQARPLAELRDHYPFIAG